MTILSRADLSHLLRRSAASFVLCLLIAGSAAAKDRWQVRLMATQIEPGDGFETGAGDEFLLVEPRSELDDAVGVDYRLSSRFSLGLEVLDSALDLDIDVRLDGVEAQGSSRFDFTLINLGLDVDLTPPGGFSLTLGPVVAWVDYGDAVFDLREIDATGSLTFDDEITYGLRLRADVPFGRWSILAAVETYDASARSTNPDLDLVIDIEVDPTLYQLGAGVRF